MYLLLPIMMKVNKDMNLRFYPISYVISLSALLIINKGILARTLEEDKMVVLWGQCIEF